MFKFKIFEIPEGKSERLVQLKADNLDLGGPVLKTGTLEVELNRTLHFIHTKLQFNIVVELICDRSLDLFEFRVDTEYEILFKKDIVEESADENGSIRKINWAKNEIDIEQDVLDTILVNLPAKKLHPRFLDEDGNPIEFLEEKFGDFSSDSSEGESIDPRWEALKDLKN